MRALSLPPLGLELGDGNGEEADEEKQKIVWENGEQGFPQPNRHPRWAPNQNAPDLIRYESNSVS